MCPFLCCSVELSDRGYERITREIVKCEMRNGCPSRFWGRLDSMPFGGSRKDASPQSRKVRKGCAESMNQISAPPLRPMRLCGESEIQCYQTVRSTGSAKIVTRTHAKSLASGVRPETDAASLSASFILQVRSARIANLVVPFTWAGRRCLLHQPRACFSKALKERQDGLDHFDSSLKGKSAGLTKCK